MAGAKGRRPTPAAKVREFREKYLELGIARAAARAVGIPERTGIDLAQRAEADPEFAQQRADLRARYLPEVEAILRDCVGIAHERIQNEPLTPEQQAELMQQYGLKSFSMPDPRPAYMAQIVRTAQVLNHNAEKGTEQAAPSVTVNVAPLVTQSPESDGPDD